MHVFTPSLRHKLSAPCAGYSSWTQSVIQCHWNSPRRHETVITVASQGKPGGSATGGRVRKCHGSSAPPSRNGSNGNSPRQVEKAGVCHGWSRRHETVITATSQGEPEA
jgi:hypothetical protein